MSGYESLMNYYRECFSLVDCFHFNNRRDYYYRTKKDKVNRLYLFLMIMKC